MQQVYTDEYGYGQIVESKTTRGRTEYRVAGQDFDVWMPATKVGFAPVDRSNSVDLPYDPAPQYGVGPLTESTIQPIHEIDADERTSPADSLTFEDRSRDEGDERGTPGPNPDLFAKSAGLGYPSHGGMEADPEDAYPAGHPFHEQYQDNQAEGLYGGGHPGIDTNPHHFDEEGMDEDPYAPVSADQWMSTDAQQNRFGSYHQADVLNTDIEKTPFEPGFMVVNDTEDEYLRDQDVTEDDRETTGPDGIVHFAEHHGRFLHANPAALAVPLARGVAQGLAGGAAERAIHGDPNVDPAAQDSAALGADLGGQIGEQISQEDPLPLPSLGGGWGDLTTKHGSYRPAGLDSRYADTHAPVSAEVAAFRNDPAGFITRAGHVHGGCAHHTAQYGELVEADEMLRTAAWKDVRQKAQRLRREGRVTVKDVDYDRIYASVQGDHGTYDVMIKKGGAYGGGGAQSITHWHCACDWGKWAFQRRLTFVGRLCSHGYAAYLTMQSSHLNKGGKGNKGRRPYQKQADDQTIKDWTVRNTGEARGALEDIRDWAERPQEDDLGNMEDRVEQIRDDVERAREKGVDADQLVASLRRHAAPGDPVLPYGPGNNPSSTPKMPSNSPFAGGDAFNESQPAAPTAAPAGGGSAAAPFSSANPVTPYAPGNEPASPLPEGSAFANPGGVYDKPGGAAPGTGTGAPAAGGSDGPNFYNQQYGQGNGTKGDAAGEGGAAGGQPNAYNEMYNQGNGVKGDAPGEGGAAAGGGTYEVQSGDTLSGIAESQGLGDNWQGLYDSNKDVIGGDANLIQPGQKLDLSAAGGSSGTGADTSAAPAVQGPGIGGNDTAAVSAPGDPASAAADATATNKTSRRRHADLPADPATAPVTPGAAVPPPVTPQATTDAATGASAVAGPIDTAGTAAVDDPAASGTQTDPGTTSDMGASPMSGGLDGFGDVMSTVGDIGGMIGDGVGMATDAIGGVTDAISGIFSSRQLHADRDWLMAAYPDGTADHKPFNGSGGFNKTDWEQSKDNVKDNYSDNREDVTEEPEKNHLTKGLDQARADWGKGQSSSDGETVTAMTRGAGITRAGNGPRRPPVEPEVVSIRAPRQARAVEAEHIPDDFDPYSKTAADFSGEEAPRDIVAEFQRQAAAGGSALDAPGGGGGQYDDFAASPAFRQAMLRTAGRNYSPAEQAALIQEGKRGGAGNLDQLDLRGTHYEAENSVGLW